MKEITLTDEQMQFIVDSLVADGEVRIKGLMDIKYSTSEGGKVLIDPRNPSKGFRITDMKVHKIASTLSRTFKDRVKLAKKG